MTPSSPPYDTHGFSSYFLFSYPQSRRFFLRTSVCHPSQPYCLGSYNIQRYCLFEVPIQFNTLGDIDSEYPSLGLDIVYSVFDHVSDLVIRTRLTTKLNLALRAFGSLSRWLLKYQRNPFLIPSNLHSPYTQDLAITIR